MLAVSYEALVLSAEAQLDAVCRHPGVPFTAPLLDATAPSAYPPGASTAWAQGHFERAASPIATDALDAWRERLTRSEAAAVAWVVGPRLVAAGYAPDPGTEPWHATPTLARSLWRRLARRGR